MTVKTKARILLLDIETAPNVAYVWRFFKTNIGAKQVLERGYMLSFAAKWLDDDKVYYADVQNQNEKSLLKDLLPLLEEADMVVAHNGERFDMPQIRGRYLQHGMAPPSPVKVIDTYKIAKKEFGFPSNSLEYLTTALNCSVQKGGHKEYPGFELWLGVLRDDPKAWAEMKLYNIDDILAMESLYLKMRPYARFHPNVAVFSEDNKAPACPKCGEQHLVKRGFAYTNVGKFQRYRCEDCGGWSKGRTSLVNKDLAQNVTTNVVN